MSSSTKYRSFTNRAEIAAYAAEQAEWHERRLDAEERIRAEDHATRVRVLAEASEWARSQDSEGRTSVTPRITVRAA